LSEFIEAGYFNRHIRKMRKLYAARQKSLIQAARQLQNYISISDSSAGMHLVGWLKKSLSDQKISDLAAADGIEVPAVSAYCLDPIGRMGLLFGYAAFDEQQMRKAIRALLNVFKSQ
jgi:GntR family transcriptional regulator / MocR family aminotransferase